MERSIARRPLASTTTRIALQALAALAAAGAPRASRAAPFDAASVAARGRSAVVAVRAWESEASARPSAVGAPAVLIGEGLALTALHAVARFDEAFVAKPRTHIEVVLPGREAPASAALVAYDARLGVAVLRLAGEGAPASGLPLADKAPERGDALLALGPEDVEPLVVAVENVDSGMGAGLLWTSGRFSPRLWGGPLLDAEGFLAGIALPGGNGGSAMHAEALRRLVSSARVAPAGVARTTAPACQDGTVCR